jgi:hypothetical protein
MIVPGIVMSANLPVIFGFMPKIHRSTNCEIWGSMDPRAQPEDDRVRWLGTTLRIFAKVTPRVSPVRHYLGG